MQGKIIQEVSTIDLNVVFDTLIQKHIYYLRNNNDHTLLPRAVAAIYIDADKSPKLFFFQISDLSIMDFNDRFLYIYRFVDSHFEIYYL